MQDSITVVSQTTQTVAAPSDAAAQETKETQKTSATEETQVNLEASDTSTDNVSEQESEEQADDSTESEAKDESAPKKKNGVQKRIDKLRARAAKAEQEAAELRQALLANSQNKSQPTQEAPQAKEAKTTDEPNPDNFETHTEYVKAVAKWTLEQDKKQAKEQDEQTKAAQTYQELGKSYQASLEKLKAEKPDFKEVEADVAHVTVPAFVESEILNSEFKAELAYEMAKDPDEFERICSLPPLQAAKAIAVYEDRLARRKSETAEKPKPTKTKTGAPPPLSPTGSKAVVAKSLAQMDPDEYMAARKQGAT